MMTAAMISHNKGTRFLGIRWNVRDRFDSILPLWIHFIYRNTFPQNTKIDDGEIYISESILYHFANVREFLVIH
jgi:hypothetical protein